MSKPDAQFNGGLTGDVVTGSESRGENRKSVNASLRASAAVVLDKFLVWHSYLRRYPGKTALYRRLMPFVQPTWIRPRLRTRFGVRFECDLRDKVPRGIYYTGYNRRNCRSCDVSSGKEA